MDFPRFCRACAREVKADEACEIENNPEKPELPLLLKRYVPEINVKIENACLCTDCISMLTTYHKFKRKCLQTEGDLRLYKRKHPNIRTVNDMTMMDIFTRKENKKNAVDNTKISAGNFVYQSNTALRRHNYHNHSGPDKKLFQCEVCGKRFTEESALAVHMRTHTGKNSYECPVCEFVAHQLRTLYIHLSLKHNIVAKGKFEREKNVVL